MSTSSFGDPRFYRSNELALGETLAKIGHNITLFSSDRYPNMDQDVMSAQERRVVDETDVASGFKIRRVPTGIELGHVAVTPSMLTQIVSFPCDILHTHEVIAPASFFCALASRMMGTPLVITQHDYLYGNTRGMKLVLYKMNNNTVGRFTLRTAKSVIGVNSKAVRYVEQFGADPRKTQRIPTSVDTSTFRPDQENLLEARWGIRKPAVLFVGRLIRRKGVDVLVKAFRELQLTLPNVNLVIVGKGPEESHLRELSQRLIGNHVFFVGKVPREEMPRIYSGASLLVLPSLYYEIFGNVLIEAMASGLPIIATKVGGMEEILAQGKTGYFVKPGDASELSGYMKRVLTDPILQQSLSRTARRETLEQYDDMVIARKVESIYRECLTN